MSSSQWAPQLRLFDGHASVSAVDLPGHGSRDRETFTLPRSIDVVDAAVAQAPTGAAVVVVGHSLGGYVAMAHAAARGDRLDGLVLADCSATPAGPGAAIYRAVARLTARIGPQRMTRFNDWVLRSRYAPEVIDDVLVGGYFFEATPAAWQAVMGSCRPSMLSGFTRPVLVLNGQYDQFRLREKSFVRQIPGARLEIIRGAGHLATFDRPRAFAEAVLRFAASVDPSTGDGPLGSSHGHRGPRGS